MASGFCTSYGILQRGHNPFSLVFLTLEHHKFYSFCSLKPFILRTPCFSLYSISCFMSMLDHRELWLPSPLTFWSSSCKSHRGPLMPFSSCVLGLGISVLWWTHVLGLCPFICTICFFRFDFLVPVSLTHYFHVGSNCCSYCFPSHS